MSGPAIDRSRTRAVLDFIKASIAKKGYPPTIREIMGHFKWKSTNGPRFHLQRLIRSGELIRDKKVSRGLRVP